LGFFQRSCSRRLVADKYRAKISFVEQGEQFWVIGQIDACFGVPAQRIAMLLLLGNNRSQQFFGRLLVADEIIVDDKGGQKS